MTLSALILGLTGCDQQPGTQEPPVIEVRRGDNMSGPEVAKKSRITVTIIGTFYDDIAYGDTRGIYHIVDNVTGREYFGISGVGISDLGAHTVSNGKTTTTHSDER